MSEWGEMLSRWAKPHGDEVSARVSRVGVEPALRAARRGRAVRSARLPVAAAVAVAALVGSITQLPAFDSLTPGLGADGGRHYGELPALWNGQPDAPGVRAFACGDYEPFAPTGVTWASPEVEARANVELEGSIVVWTGTTGAQMAPRAGSIALAPTDFAHGWIGVVEGTLEREDGSLAELDLAVQYVLVQEGVVFKAPADWSVEMIAHGREVGFSGTIDRLYSPFPPAAWDLGRTGASFDLTNYGACSPPAGECPPETYCNDAYLAAGTVELHTVVQLRDPDSGEVVMTAVDAVDLGATTVTFGEVTYAEWFAQLPPDVRDEPQPSIVTPAPSPTPHREPSAPLAPPEAGAIHTGYVVPPPGNSCDGLGYQLMAGSPIENSYTYDVELPRIVPLDDPSLFHQDVVITVPAGQEPWYLGHNAWLVTDRENRASSAVYLTWESQPDGSWTLAARGEIDLLVPVNGNCFWPEDGTSLHGPIFLVFAGVGPEPASEPAIDWVRPTDELMTWVYLGEAVE